MLQNPFISLQVTDLRRSKTTWGLLQINFADFKANGMPS